MQRRFAQLALSLVVLLAPDMSKAGSAAPPFDRASVAQELRTGGYSLRLRCEAWRNRMPQVIAPGAKPQARRLMIVLSLAETAKRPIKGVFKLKEVRMFQDGGNWGATLEDELPWMSPSEVNYSVPDPPDWPAGTAMDVIVRVMDQQGSELYIQSKGCRIEEVS
jgi:hypothetical protein